jgi:hypothetical protein
MNDETQMTLAERNSYTYHKERFSKGVQQAAESLLAIRDGRLYREDYATFEDFCRGELGKTRHSVNYIIKAGEVLKSLPDDLVTIVTKESQLRELSKAPPEAREEIVRKVVSEGKPTAAKIKEAVREVIEADEIQEPVRNELSHASGESQSKSGEDSPSNASPDAGRKMKRPPRYVPCNGMMYANSAITQLQKIDPKDKEKAAALTLVLNWIKERL